MTGKLRLQPATAEAVVAAADHRESGQDIVPKVGKIQQLPGGVDETTKRLVGHVTAGRHVFPFDVVTL